MKPETRERLRELFDATHILCDVHQDGDCVLTDTSWVVAMCGDESEAELIAALLNARDEILGEGNDAR